MKPPRKLPSLRHPPRMLHHKPYRETWKDYGLAVAIGLVLATILFNHL